MLVELHIAGLGVIDDALIEFGPGLTVVTGETGAGKTMVVTGLGLLFGARADAGAVRTGVGQTLVEGRVNLPPSGPVVDRVQDAGGALDGDQLVLSRTVSAEGRSRAHVGGRSVPVAMLGELAEELVESHAQSHQLRLARSGVQRALLDRYGGEAISQPLHRYQQAYRDWTAVSAELRELTTRARERAQEADLLRHGIAEIAGVAPEPGEDVELATRIARLTHAESLRVAAGTAHDALTGGDDSDGPGGRRDLRVDGTDALGLVADARRSLDAARGHDPALDALAEQLAEVSYQLADLAVDLSSYVSTVDVDPTELAAAHERQSALSGLLRKYADDIAGVLAWQQTAQARLAELDGDDGRITELTARHAELLATLAGEAAAVSAARTTVADQLAAAVTSELRALAMPHAALTVAVEQSDNAAGLPVGERRLTFGPHGIDDVEFRFASGSDSPARPLARAASGGELSRVMLALEVVLAGVDPVPTFVFDEVDAGVGGRAAVEVGRRLAALARTSQVIAVTHLPQVAAFADQHVVVAKNSRGAVTRADVRAVDGPDRVRELSRMLAGLDDSALAHGHAEELLATAAAAKADVG